MRKILIYLLINFYCVYGNVNVLIPIKKDYSKYSSISECVITISDTELYFRPTVVILKQKEQGKEANTFIYNLIKKLREYDKPQVIFNDHISKENYNLHINSLIIAVFDKCEHIMNFDFERVDLKMKFLIILSDLLSDDCLKKVQAIAENVKNYDVTFIMQDAVADQNKMYTILPVIDESTCKVTVGQPTHINTCFNGILQSKEIFPIKNPVNLNKCPFKVGMATLYPFSSIKDKDLLKTTDRVKEIQGFDYEIMKIVAKYFNATLDLYYIYRKEENPYGDFEFLKLLLNGSLDACAGGLYRIYGRKFEYSGIYVSQGVFWMYYAERADRSWENLIHKLDDVYVFLIFYITYAFVWYFITFIDQEAVSLKSTLMYSWGALVGATSLQEARSLKQKLLNLMYLIMCIYLSAYISMQFYAFLTIRGPPQMFKTNDEVMASGRTPFLKTSTKYFITEEKYVKFANSSEECSSFVDCAEKTLQNNGLTVMLQANFFQFQAESSVNDEARTLRATENILTVYNEMIIRKNSSLVVKFQKVVLRLFEAGIARRLFTKAVGISVVAKAESANANMMANSYSCQAGCSITLKQIAGVFYAWIFGCVLSSIVFVIEIITTRKNRPIISDRELYLYR